MSDPQHPVDAWIDELIQYKETPYMRCPCGCGQKMRFVVKAGGHELQKHELAFIRNYKKEHDVK